MHPVEINSKSEKNKTKHHWFQTGVTSVYVQEIQKKFLVEHWATTQKRWVKFPVSQIFRDCQKDVAISMYLKFFNLSQKQYCNLVKKRLCRIKLTVFLRVSVKQNRNVLSILQLRPFSVTNVVLYLMFYCFHIKNQKNAKHAFFILDYLHWRV